MPRSLSSLLWLSLGALLLTSCHTTLDRHLARVEDRAVEYATAGDGGTTVVFEAGLGNDWSSWDPVAGQVARVTRVFAYSRAGYGGSEPSAAPRDPRHIVEELRALLAAQGVAPPYVLVGHSFGGAYLELFAKAYPAEVAGLVLVDPRHRDYSAACEGAGLTGCGIPAAAVATLPAVQRAEYAGYALASEEISAVGPFGAYPVRVLIATVHPPENPQREALWASMLTSLAKEAADGQAMVFPGAGHGLQYDRQDEVVRAIVAVVQGVGR